MVLVLAGRIDQENLASARCMLPAIRNRTCAWALKYMEQDLCVDIHKWRQHRATVYRNTPSTCAAYLEI